MSSAEHDEHQQQHNSGHHEEQHNSGQHATAPAHPENVFPPLSRKRLAIATILMLTIGALALGPSVYYRSFAALFIPVWLILTLGVVLIMSWFIRALLTVERSRDSEPVYRPEH